MTTERTTPGGYREMAQDVEREAEYAERYGGVSCSVLRDSAFSLRCAAEDAEKMREMREALEPFARFAVAWDAHPIKGVDENHIYGIHGGEDFGGASLSLAMFRRARTLLGGDR